MITIYTKKDIKRMRSAGKLVSHLLDHLTPYIKPGVSTGYLDDLAYEYLIKHGATSAALGYHGFPKNTCTSINNVICHGIPSDEDILKSGDIINIDVVANLNGYHGDHSRMFMVGEVSEDAKQLVLATKKAMEIGIAAAKPGGHFGDIGKAIEQFITPLGYSIVRDFGGHGVGKHMHEEPFIAHFDTGKSGEEIKPGMMFTVEPMINMGLSDLYIEDDDWTAKTMDGSLSAQWEHTVLMTEHGPEKLTVS